MADLGNKNKNTRISINIELDENSIPHKIQWSTEDGPQAGKVKECKAFLLSLFDSETRDTLKIDLWTKEMQVMEMDRFFYQTLRSLSDTYMKATSNKELANDMMKFVQYFGERVELFPKK